MKKIFVTGFIKTTSPLHITAPSAARFDPEDAKKIFDSKRGVSLNSIQTIAVPTVFESKKSTDSNGDVENPFQVEPARFSGVVNVPVIAGNNLSGRIRREIASVFIEALRDNGESIDLTTYSAINCGAATGNPDGAPISYDEFKKASEHPFVGLLGGGPRMINREAKINNAIAMCVESKNILNHSRVPYEMLYEGWDDVLATHNADIKARDLTGIWGFRRIDDLKELANIALAEKSISNFSESFNARQSQIIEEFKKSKEELNSKSSTHTYQSLEFVLPSVSFPFVARLNKLSDVQIGLWFKGFERFVQNVSIGGWDRCGFGDFVFCDSRLAVFEDNDLQHCESFDPMSGGYDDDGMINRCLAAWSAAAPALLAKDINYLMRLPVEKSGKAPKKGEVAVK